MRKLFTSTVILVASAASADLDLAEFASASFNCQKADVAIKSYGKREALRGYWMTSETQTAIKKGCQVLDSEEDKAKCTLDFESMQLASQNYASKASINHNKLFCKKASSTKDCTTVCFLQKTIFGEPSTLEFCEELPVALYQECRARVAKNFAVTNNRVDAIQKYIRE